jgi:hypothetical protein
MNPEFLENNNLENPDKGENLPQDIIEKIESLPIDIDDKITTLLVLSEAKPVGRIELRGLQSVLRKGMSLNEFRALGIDEEADCKNQVTILEQSFEELKLLYFIEWNKNPRGVISFESPKIYFSKHEELLEKAKHAKNAEEEGLALGYPLSAVEAFQSYIQGNNESSILKYDLPDEIKKQPFFYFIRFRLSGNNWQEEIKTAEMWASVVKKNSPKLFDKFIKEQEEFDKI